MPLALQEIYNSETNNKKGTCMKKIVMSMLAAAAMTMGANAQLLTWNTFGNLGTETTEPSVFNAANITSANLTFGAGVTPAANGNRFGGSAWFDSGDTVAGTTLAESISGNDYIQFIVTPSSGFQFTATSFQFYWDRSTTGPTSITLRSSLDGFANNLGTVTGLATGGTFALNTLTITGLANVSAATTFRLYGYGGTATGGTGGFDSQTTPVDLSLNPNILLFGSISAIPEPTTNALLLCASLLILTALRRKTTTTL
jgi:hypothetical protein